MRVHRGSRVAKTLVTISIAALVLCANAFGHGGGQDKNGCHLNKKTGGRHCHGKAAKDTRRSVCDGKVPAVGDENVLHGRVVSVTDGDTFNAKIQGAVMKFRMADIDAPEMDQPYGREARKILAAALDGKDVVMLRVDNDPYGRLVVQVWIARLHINGEVMAQGTAWFDREYAHDDCLFHFENEARDAKKGLWKLPIEDRVEPWVWRQRKRAAAGAQRRRKSWAKCTAPFAGGRADCL